MKKYFTVLACLLSLFADAKPHVKKVRKRAIPSEIDYAGKAVRAVRWTDKMGDNMVVVSRTKKAKSTKRPEQGYYDAYLDAYRFVYDGKHWRYKWHMHDQAVECDLVLYCQFVKNTFELTDLNNDGTLEVWLVDKTICSDPYVCNMNVVMYEGDKRYTLKGRNRVHLAEAIEKENEFGEYNFDADFNKATPVFREHALKVWNENIKTKIKGKVKKKK